MYQICLLLLCVFVLGGCAAQKSAPQEKTQLEVREFQTRTYDVDNMRLVMKSVLNVLQDDNYIVKNVALDLGFLTATKEQDIEDSSDRFWALFARANEARWQKNEIIEATINVSEFGKNIRVRANFQSKILDNQGGLVRVQQIIDENFYKDFFGKVDKGIFLQQQNL